MTSVSGSAEGKREAVVTACPDCGGYVRLPTCVNLDVVVQCPMCDTQYPLRSVLPETIPELILVKHDGSDGASGDQSPEQELLMAPTRLEVPSILRNGSRRGKRRRSRGDSAGSSPRDSKPQGSRPAGNRSSRSSDRTSHAWAEAVKRDARPKNQWVEMAKVAIGGLMALPVAQVIIWWLIGMDPLNIAPAVARWVPFVVPAKLQQATEAENTALLGPGSAPSQVTVRQAV